MSTGVSMIARKLVRGSEVPSRDPKGFRLLTYAVVTITAAALALGVLLDPKGIAHTGWRALPWIAGVMLADLASLDTSRASLQLSFSYPMLLAAAFIYSPTVAGIVALLGTIDPRELRREITITHGLFNRCQIALCVMAASAVFHAMGGEHLRWPLVLGAGVVAVASDMAVNALLVSAGVRLLHRVEWRYLAESLVMGRPGYFLLTYGLYGLSALIFRELFLLYGFWAFAAFAIPIVLGHEVFTHGERLSLANRELEAKGKALEGVSQTIADERRDERAKVAASLHDEVLQQLHHVHLMGEVLRHDLSSGRLLDLEHDLPELLQATESAADSIRSVIRDLRASSVGKGGLTPTVALLVADLSARTIVPIEADLADVGGTPQIQLLIYQVAREALQNAVKHSEASRIEIHLQREGSKIRLTVCDDGRGFRLGAVDRSQHFGLELIRERLTLVGGRLEILTAPGEGTRVIAEFPWEAKF